MLVAAYFMSGIFLHERYYLDRADSHSPLRIYFCYHAAF